MENISIIKTILVGWREGKWGPKSYTITKLWWSQQMFCEAVMSLCPVDCAVDFVSYKLHLLPAGIPASHFGTMNSASQLEYQGTKPNLLSQVTAATWLWLRDRQAVGYETTGHCRHCSTEGICTYTRTSETQHQAVSDMQCKEDVDSTPYPSRKPQSSKIVLIQGRSSILLNSQTSHLQPSQHDLLSIHVHLSPSILTPICPYSFLYTYMFYQPVYTYTFLVM